MYSLARLVDDLLEEVWELLDDGDGLARGEADAVHRRRRVVRRLAQPRRRKVLRRAALRRRCAAVVATAVVIAAAVGAARVGGGLDRRRLCPLLDLGRGRLGRFGRRLLHRRHRLLLLLPLVGVNPLLAVRVLLVVVPAGVLVPCAGVVADRG